MLNDLQKLAASYMYIHVGLAILGDITYLTCKCALHVHVHVHVHQIFPFTCKDSILIWLILMTSYNKENATNTFLIPGLGIRLFGTCY